ncbi:hypothetical protein D9615_009394 [Tricholomella constricta]|uniref:Jacalin-type lectin domain-containing protein n=1 Tax=Tricholomella constricta TaxID=117010 RepID=A0A8H5H2T1_9AGAR|nr:hypothetical protein D9615_009394 [Tricholomella constricta]
MLPPLALSQSIGYISEPASTFDDLKDVGLWPADQTIKKISKINVWAGETRPNAIELTYQLINDDDPQTRLHGQRQGDQHTVTVADNEYFVGIFGAIDSDNLLPSLRRIGFLVYNKNTGNVTERGPFPDTTESDKHVKGFASGLGVILALTGTLTANKILNSFAIYSLQSDGLDFGIKPVMKI